MAIMPTRRPTTSASATTIARKPASRSVDVPRPGMANRSKYGCVCDSPSYRMAPVAMATSVTSDASQRPAEEAVGEALTADPARPGRPEPRVAGESVEEAEPDREHLTVGAPRVPTELGHAGERDERVGQDDQAHVGASEGELEPHEHGEADDRRPRREPRWIRRRAPAPDAQTPQDPGADVVEGRERVEPLPDRDQQRAHDGEADPAVDPGEERAHLGARRPAHEELGDDPGPADQAQRSQDEDHRDAARSGCASPSRAASARRRRTR